jgi:hypothetical protein
MTETQLEMTEDKTNTIEKVQEKLLRSDICRDLMLNRKCDKISCKYIHKYDNNNICFHHWKFDHCRFGDSCKKAHIIYANKYDKNKGNNEKEKNNNNKGKKEKKEKLLKSKNTESFEPMKKPVDVRFVYDNSISGKLNKKLTERDIVLIPNLFNDFEPNKIYNQLMSEISNCGIPNEKLFKLWHGDTHFIADDKLNLPDKTTWKSKMPTFNMVIERIQNYFNMDIKATRFNYYKDTSQFKPFHFDAAAIKPEKEKTQNFTIGVNFGTTREVAFERDTKDKTVVSFPLSDGEAYGFCKTTNLIWRHGILQDLPIKDEGRISIICWGKIDY